MKSLLSISRKLFKLTSRWIAKLILNKNKRLELDVDDVKRAMEVMGCIKIYGHENSYVPKFVYIPEARVYVEGDPEILVPDGALNESIYANEGKPYIQGQWIMPIGFCEEEEALQPPTSYYISTAKVLTMGTPDLVKIALHDLRTNSKIAPECPYFLNLVALIVKQHSSRDYNLTDNLISSVEAIVKNKFLCLTPFMAGNRAANALLKIVIEAPILNNDSDMVLRFRAGVLLASIIKKWRIEYKQFMSIAKHLLEYLMDSAAATQSHFGSVVTLTALGEEALISYVWPIIEVYLKLLAARVVLSLYFDPYTLHIMAAVIAATRFTLDRSRFHVSLILAVHRLLYMTFGDSTIPLRQARRVGKFISDITSLYPKEKQKNLSKSSMKLKIHEMYKKKKIKTLIINEWSCLCDVFEDTDKHSYNCILGPRLDLEPASNSPKQLLANGSTTFFVYVPKNLKFSKRLHKLSPAGDIYLLL